jgi:hypothetical protein
MIPFLQLELEDLSTYGTLVDGEKKAGSRIPLADGSRITLTHGRTIIVELLPEPPPVTPWGARLQLKRPPLPAGSTGSGTGGCSDSLALDNPQILLDYPGLIPRSAFIRASANTGTLRPIHENLVLMEEAVVVVCDIGRDCLPCSSLDVFPSSRSAAFCAGAAPHLLRWREKLDGRARDEDS